MNILTDWMGGKKDIDPELIVFLRMLCDGNLNDTFNKNLKLLEDEDAIFTKNNLIFVSSSILEKLKDLKREKDEQNSLIRLNFVFRFGVVLRLIKNDASKSAREEFAQICKSLITENSVEDIQTLIKTFSLSRAVYALVERGFKGFDVSKDYFPAETKDSLELHLYVALLYAIVRKTLTSVRNLSFALNDWFSKAEKQQDDRPYLTPTHYFRIMWPVFRAATTPHDLKTLFSKIWSLIKAQAAPKESWVLYYSTRAQLQLEATERSVNYIFELLTSTECLSLLALLGNDMTQELLKVAKSFSNDFVSSITAEAGALLITRLESSAGALEDEAKERTLQEVRYIFSTVFIVRLLDMYDTPWSLIIRVTKSCKSHEDVLVGLITEKLVDLTDSRPNWYLFSSFAVEDISGVGGSGFLFFLLQISVRQLCHYFRGSETLPQKQKDNLVFLLDQYFTSLSPPDEKDLNSYVISLFQPLLSLLDGLKDYETASRRRVLNSHSMTIKLIGKVFGLLIVLLATESPICTTVLESLEDPTISERVFREITEQFSELCDKTSFFQNSYMFAIAELDRFEAKSGAEFEPQGEDGLSFPKLYLSLARGFGEAVFRLKMRQGSLDKTTHLKGLLAVIQKQSEKPKMSVVSILFTRSVLDHVCCLFQDCVLRPAPDLNPLLNLIHHTSEGNVRKVLWNEVYLPKIEQYVANNRKAIDEQRVSMANLSYLLEEGGEQYLTRLETALPGPPKEDLKLFSLHSQFTVEQGELDTLRGVANFLRMRNLLPNHASIDAILNISSSAEDLLLCDLVARNADLRAEFLNDSGEPFTEKTLNALRTFCANGCAIFASRFDDTCARLNQGGTQKLDVDAITTETLRRLEMLVSAADARVDDFDSDFTVVIAEFQGKGQKQRRLQSELELVVQFFRNTYSQNKDGHNTAEYLVRLQAAFTLLRIRESITPFLATMQALNLGALVAQVISSPELQTVNENFLIVEAEQLLDRIQVLLQGLTQWELGIIGKLTNENALTAQLLLSFFRRTATDFDGALERATNRAAVNAHVVDVLLLLPDVRLLLQPLWDPAHTPGDLATLAGHFKDRLVWSERAGSDPVCVSLQEVLSVLENWGEVEAFFRDGGDAQTGTGDIKRLVQVYRKSGKFFSEYQSLNDQGLSFTYGSMETPVSLSPDALQEHVQWAVLGTEGKTGEHEASTEEGSSEREILSDFVDAYRAARKAHGIRMKLTEAGHPEFQVTFGAKYSRFPIASSCLASDVLTAVEVLQHDLSVWQELLRTQYQDNPRLLLLGRRSLVQLILTLKGHIDTRSPQFLRQLTSYLLLCFPMPLQLRTRFEEVVVNAVNSVKHLLETPDHKVEDVFQIIVSLLQFCEKDLEELQYLRYEPTDSVERLDVSNRPVSDLFGSYLADAFSINYHCAVGQPGTTLWGDRSVTEHAIQEFLALASVGAEGGTLFGSLHVLHVERLTPRMRRELLQGIQNAQLKSQILLLFGSQIGADTFSHYRLGEAGTAEDASSCLDSTWAACKDADGVVNASVSVVCGGSGVGKSRWIEERVQGSKIMRVVVHEGFDCARTIHRFEALQESLEYTAEDQATADDVCNDADVLYEDYDSEYEGDNDYGEFDENQSAANDNKSEENMSEARKVQFVSIHFDVTEFGDLQVLSQFLHHLLVFGTLFDVASGKLSMVGSKIRLRVFIEFPTLSEDFGCVWPPADVTRHSEKHPFLAELPILSLWCAKYQRDYLFIDEKSPFLLDRKSHLVSTYLNFLSDSVIGRAAYNFLDPQPLPIFHGDARIVNHNVCRITLNSFFASVAPDGNKRLLSTVIKVLYSRILYFVRIHSAFHRENGRVAQQSEDTFISQLTARFSEPNAFERLLRLFVEESLCIANENSHSGNVVITVRPRYQSAADIFPPEAYFDAVIASPNGPANDRRKRDELMSLFQNCNYLNTEEPAIPPFLRAVVAPIFGMKDSSKMIRTLRDLGFVLTSDALVMLVQLHSRRLAGIATILEGETGCGKSQLVKLYSLLINSDSNLFTNIKLHLLALIQALVKWKKNILSAEGNTVDPDFVKVSDALLESSMCECSAPELINFIIAWVTHAVALDHALLQFVSTLICLYLRALMTTYPLHEKGLNAGAANTLNRFKVFFSQSSRPQEETNTLLELLHQAASTLFLTPEGRRVEQFDLTSTEGGDRTEMFPIISEQDLREFLTQVLESSPASLYYRVLADQGLDALKWRSFIQGVAESASEIQRQCPTACICVFVDELNTAGCLGLVTEALTTHSCNGIPLPPNIFFCGAINPFLPRPSAAKGNFKVMDFTKSNIVVPDAEALDDDYLAGAPYIVKALTPSLLSSRLSCPTMSERTEERFLFEYLQSHASFSAPPGVDRDVWSQRIELGAFYDTALKIIVRAQQLVRGYKIPRVYMSIRNLIRAAELLNWFLQFSVPTEQAVDGRLFNQENIFLPQVRDRVDHGSRGKILHQEEIYQTKQQMLHALIMAVTVVYWFQLPSQGHVVANRCDQDLRSKFIEDITAGLEEIGWGRYFFSNREIDNYAMSVEDRNMLKWKKVIFDSLDHLWSRAKIPVGLAKTNAMMENFYCIVLCAENRIPLLITGPPGCGKTLSFVLACENLAGKSQQHSVAFQQLKKARKYMYNCSPESTGPELAARFSDASKQQRLLDQRQPGLNVCMVGVDEAGLAPENRQALKSLHDYLDMRLICPVLMSNTTLDAAKTSRTIQLLQTQANLEDLEHFAWSILVDNPMRSAPERVRQQWRVSISGLCKAFYQLPSDSWFHSRDFAFLCRLLNKTIEDSKRLLPSLFDASMLLYALRRHFQMLDPSKFPDLARHFLFSCSLEVPVDISLGAEVLQHLRESLRDRPQDVADAALTHCRYTMVVDPTDCEVAVDLLFALNLLDHSNTKVISLSDFPEDVDTTNRTALLAQIFAAIEKGETLLLVNSAPIQASLYDVINRHYSYSVANDGSYVAFASIALGSFSRFVRVHPDFRLVVHVAQSQLPQTPLPFLNRLEKYTLSVRDAFEKRVGEVAMNPPSSLRTLHTRENRIKFFSALQSGMEDFLQFCGGKSSFYGVAARETIPALLLRALEDSCDHPEDSFTPKPSLLSILRSHLLKANTYNTAQNQGTSLGNEDEEGQMDVIAVEEAEWIMASADSLDPCPSTDSSPSTRVREVVRALNLQLLETMRVESLFRLRSKLPSEYLREYMEVQEHFTATQLISLLIAGKCVEGPTAACDKLIVYTRTDETLQRLGSDRDPHFARNIFIGGVAKILSDKRRFYLHFEVCLSSDKLPSACPVGEKRNVVRVVSLAAFKSGLECRKVISSCLGSNTALLLVVAAMDICTAAQVTYARHVVDSSLALYNEQGTVGLSSSTPSVVFLLHVSAEKLQLRPCYQTIPLNDWHSVYVDSFCVESSPEPTEINIQPTTETQSVYSEHQNSLHWLRVAFSYTKMPSLETLKSEFLQSAETSLLHAIHSVQLKQPRVLVNRAGLSKSLPAYVQDDKQWTTQLFRDRSFLLTTLSEAMAKVWIHLLEPTVQQACKRIAGGVTTRGLLEVVQLSMRGLLSDFMRYLYRCELTSHWNLEAIAALPSDSSVATLEEYEKTPIGAIESKDDRPLQEDHNDNHTIETEQKLIAVTQHVLRAAVLSYKPDNLSYGCGKFAAEISAGRVDCSKTGRASTMPFFHSFMRQLRGVLPYALSSARQNSIPLDQLEQDITSVRSCLLRRSVWRDLHHAVELIEKDEALWDSWTRDFIAFSLEYSSMSPAELTCLKKLAENVVHRSLTEDHHHNDADARDLVRWVLLESQLKSALHQPSILLITLRLIYSDFPTKLITTWQAPTDVISSLTEITLVQQMCQLALDSIWSSIALISSGSVSDEQQKAWMHCVRDFIPLKIVITNLDSPANVKKIAIVSILFQFSGLLGRKLSEVLKLSFTAVCESELEDPLYFGLELLAAERSENEVDLTTYRCTNFLLVIVDQVVQNYSKFSANSKYLAVLVTCLLRGHSSLTTESTWQYFKVFAELCGELSVVTRSELIYQLLQGLPEEISQLSENTFNSLLLKTGSVYVPSFLVEAEMHVTVGGKLVEARFKEETEDRLIRFNDTAAEMIVFRAIFRHVQSLNSSDSLTEQARSYLHGTQKSTGTFTAMRDAAKVVLLIDALADFVVTRNVSRSESQTQSLFVAVDRDVLDAITLIFAESPTMWPVYFVAKVCNVDLSAVLDLLLDETFWRRVGLPSWVLAPPAKVEANAMLSEEQLVALGERTRAFEQRIADINHVASYIDLNQREAVLYLPSIQQLLQSCSVTEEEDSLQSHAFKTAQLLLDRDNSIPLLSNRFIPILHNLSQFLHEKLAYRFPSEDQMMSSTAESALALLSVSDQVVGRKLFNEFLQAWTVLQKQFQTFNQCRREVAAGDTVPLKTDDKGDNCTWLRDLVPMAQETEPLTKRMLELRLLRQTSDILQHPSLQYLRDDPSLNFSSYLTDSVAPKISLDRSDHGPISSTANHDLILTGMAADKATEMACVQSLHCSLSWSVELGQKLDWKHPSTGSTAETTHSTKDLRQLLQDSKDRVARENQTRAHNDGWAVCPGCRRVWEKIDGCDHVCCGQCNNPYGGGVSGRGRTLGELGCGLSFTYASNRVPLPRDGQPLHPHFAPELAPLPPELSGITSVTLPERTPLRGSFQVDWLACCRVLLSRCIHGRALLQLGDCLKSSLPLSLSLTGEDEGPLSTLTSSHHQVYRNTLERTTQEFTSGMGAANAFVRLRVFAERIQRTLSADSIGSSADSAQRAHGEGEGTYLEAVFNYLQRQGERALENIADGMISLSLHFLSLASLSTDQPELLSDILVLNSNIGETTHVLDMTVTELIATARETALNSQSQSSSAGNTTKQWTGSFWNLIKDFPACCLAEIGSHVAMKGIEGVSDTHNLLGAAMHPPIQARLKAFGDALVADAQIGEIGTITQQAQLQELGSQLSTNEQVLLTGIESIQLRELPILKGLLSQPGNANLWGLLEGVQVRHYGQLMRFISRTLGLIAYHNLTSASSRTTGPRATGEQPVSEVYVELVPSDWDGIQANPVDPSSYLPDMVKDDDDEMDFEVIEGTVTRDYKLTLGDFGEDQVSDDPMDYYFTEDPSGNITDDNIKNMSDSTIVEEQVVMDIEPSTQEPTISEDEVVIQADPVVPIAREKRAVDLITAWVLMSSEQKEKLGATSPGDLLELTDDDLKEEVKEWKKVPRNKFLRAMGLLINQKDKKSVGSEELETAWVLMSAEQKEDIGADIAEDLMELTDDDLKEVVKEWKKVPRNKCLRIFGL